LSLFFRSGERLAITLRPNSPADRPGYDGWKEFSHRHQLPVQFEVGLKNDFKSLVGSAPFLITTSINEGFGFSFLEGWTAGKSVWGRGLPDILRDFKAHGIRLDHLYNSLEIPLDWVDAKILRQKFMQALQDACRKFNHPVDQRHFAKAFHRITAGEWIDFGLLEEDSQSAVLRRVLDDRQAREVLIQRNAYLKNPGRIENEAGLIRHNRERILALFNRRTYTRRLKRVYTEVIAKEVQQTIDKENLLNSFLHPRGFSLLKWSQPHGRAQ
jgi:glycosyltransferase involved in cell wall biosynthesis